MNPIIQKVVFYFSFSVGSRLPNQQLYVCHVERAIGEDFHQTKFKKDFHRPFDCSDLMPGIGRNGLWRVRQMVGHHENAVTFQRHQLHFEQKVGIQKPVLHTFQNHHRFAVVKVLFQFEIVIAFVFIHRCAPLF